MMRRLMIVVLAVMCASVAFAALPGPVEPPPPPVVNVTASPSSVSFGDVDEGSSQSTTVTLTNDGTVDVGVSSKSYTGVNPGEFGSAGDTCTGMILMGENCTFDAVFSPTSPGVKTATLEITLDDLDSTMVNVPVDGTGLSVVLNNPPSAPELVSPSDGAVNVATPVMFGWNESTDPDGDPVTYDLYVCEDSTFAACPTPENSLPISASVSIEREYRLSRLGGIGFVLFGITLSAGIGRRRTVALMLVVLVLCGAMLLACGGGGGGGGGGHDGSGATPDVTYEVPGLSSGTQYFWRVVATDGVDRTPSDTWSFTTI